MSGRLAALVDDLDGRSPVHPDDARRAAEEILDDPAYATPEQSLLDRGLEWLFDRIADFTDSAVGGGIGELLGWVLAIAVLGAAVLLLVRVLRLPRMRARPMVEDLEYGTESHRDPSVWLDEAARSAAEGDHRAAVRCRHQALVGAITQRQVVEPVPGRTAGEYRDRVVVERPQVSQTMRSLTDRFDAVWYGGDPIDDQGYRSFVHQCEHVEAALGPRISDSSADESWAVPA